MSCYSQSCQCRFFIVENPYISKKLGCLYWLHRRKRRCNFMRNQWVDSCGK
ncbi:hypothetical protein FCT18_01425 [Lysinibacillus sphaericus]|nr:hypothetical protein FCT18_01425 [Lysinibacillus sphaericus]